jgi:ribosomal protein S18 acetylase RimI-like enzyme
MPSFLHKKEDAERCFLLSEETQELRGAVFFAKNGLLFHCLPDACDNAFCTEAVTLLLPLFSSHEIFCVSGDLRGTKFLDELCRALRFRLLESREFHLMEYEPDQENAARDALRLERNVPEIVECTPEHENALYPLRKAYELAEVFPPGIEFVETACRNNLRRNLEKNRIVAVPHYARRGKFIAMAAINSKARSIAQIGGVFTLPVFRARGHATALTKCLAERERLEGNESVLFVRTDNASAIYSYERAGFIKTGHYAITYYLPLQK